MRREATIIVLVLLSLQTRLSDWRTTLSRDVPVAVYLTCRIRQAFRSMVPRQPSVAEQSQRQAKPFFTVKRVEQLFHCETAELGL